MLSFPLIAFAGQNKTGINDVKKQWEKNPIFGFEENKGQWDPIEGKKLDNVFFVSGDQNVRIAITNKGLSYFFTKLKPLAPEKYGDIESEQFSLEWERADMNFIGAEILKENMIVEYPSAQGHLNYYLANCPEGVLGVQVYGKVTFKNIYPGIDWVLKVGGGGDLQGLKHEFIVHPGADPSLIKIKHEGKGELTLDEAKKSITLKTSLGEITEGELFCYQNSTEYQVLSTKQKKEAKIAVPSSYEIQENTIIFKLAHFQTDQSLIIDPPLVWATYYGNAYGDGSYAIDVDNNGIVHIAGEAGAQFNTKMLAGAYNQPNHAGGGWVGSEQWTGEAYIVRFDNKGVRLWATYYGGDDSERAECLASDANGNIFMAGNTSSDNLPTKNIPGSYYKGTKDGALDIFITKFNASGALEWGTYYGGSTFGNENAYDMDVDGSGNVFITGQTRCTDFPTFDPGMGVYYQGAFGGEHTQGDAYILKFSNTGVRQWATYYGGDHDDVGWGLDIDDADNLYITGWTKSSDFPVLDPGGGAFFQNTLTPAPLGMLGPNSDIYIAKFLNSGIRIWSTYFGGPYDDDSYKVTVDPNGNVFAAGLTGSGKSGMGPTGFPTKDPGGGAFFEPNHFGGYDFFFVGFGPSLNLNWATFLGGSWNEYAVWGSMGFASDSQGNKYFAAGTFSTNFPTVDPGGGAFYQNTLQSNPGGSHDVVILQFDNTNQLVWSTLYSANGNNSEGATDLAIDPYDCVYVTGYITSDGAVTKDPGNGAFYQPDFKGVNANAGMDAFIARFGIGCLPSQLEIDLSATDISCFGGNDGTASVSVSTGVPPYTYDWQPGGGSDSVFTGLTAGMYTVTVTDNDGNIKTDSIEVKEPAELVLDPMNDEFICLGDSITLTANASGGTPNYVYLWDGNTAGNNIRVSPADSTNYEVIVTDVKGCTDTANVNVIVAQNIIALTGPGGTICYGESFPLSASGGSTYSWTPVASLDDASSATPIASPTATTTYTVTVSSGNCLPDTATVTVSVNYTINTSISNDTMICETGNPFILSASGGSTYLWSTSASTSGITVSPTTTTTYTVIVSSGSCGTDTLDVTVTVQAPPTATVSPDQTMDLGDKIYLVASGGTAYSWEPNNGLTCSDCPSPVASPTATTSYTVMVTDANGCTDSAFVTLTVESKCGEDGGLFIPNAFSPNGDGENDVFMIRSLPGCVKIISFTIFDRWGDKVFETTEDDFSWDGVVNIKSYNSAVFSYFLEAKMINGEEIIRTGNVTLVR